MTPELQLLQLLQGLNVGYTEDITAPHNPGRTFRIYVGVEGVVVGVGPNGEAINRHFITGYHLTPFRQITSAVATNLAACYPTKP